MFSSVILLFLLIFSSSIFFSNFICVIFINLYIMNCNVSMMKLMWLNNNLFSFYFIILFTFVLYLIFISYVHKHSIQFIELRFFMWLINIIKQLIIFLINSKWLSICFSIFFLLYIFYFMNQIILFFYFFLIWYNINILVIVMTVNILSM